MVAQRPDRANIWTDTKVDNELGIFEIKIGSGSRRIGPRNDEIEIDVMVEVAKLYALRTVNFCTRARS